MRNPQKIPLMRLWPRDPFLRFIILGTLLFIIDYAIVPAESGFGKEVILIDQPLLQTLADDFERSTGRAPDAAELDNLTEGWLQQEVLYREGKRLALDQGDDVIRSRVIGKMRSVIRNSATAEAPTDAVLKGWAAANSRRYGYATPHTLSFEQVTVETQREAKALAAQFNGSDQSTLPENRKSRAYIERPPERIAQQFGEAFIGALSLLPLNRWQALESRRGWHVVRLTAQGVARPLDFDTQRAAIAADWRRERQQVAIVAALRQLRERYSVRRLAP